jgi:hypothetical protein
MQLLRMAVEAAALMPQETQVTEGVVAGQLALHLRQLRLVLAIHLPQHPTAAMVRLGL